MRSRLLNHAVGLLFGCCLPACANADLILINPLATYLRTNSDGGALAASAIDLSSLSFAVSAGDFLLLEQVGDWQQTSTFPDTRRDMVAVFSSTATVLSSGMLNRIPGAIDAGTDVSTGLTFFGSLPTNILEDFSVSNGVSVFSVVIQVPIGAAFLFVAGPDSFYGDNSDPDGDFAIRITSVSSPVPEPASLLLLGFGAFTCGVPVLWRKRRRPTAFCDARAN